MKTQEKLVGLTTTRAPLLKNARQEDKLFIHQPYELYSEDNQEAWRSLYRLMTPLWGKYANEKFLQGIQLLDLQAHQIPRLEEINTYLQPLTGFQAKAVSGYVPPYLFFNCLNKREFPTTVTIRDSQVLHYLPEPDIFHDIAGHVPMHTDSTFANVLVKFGSLANLAAQQHQHVKNSEEKLAKIKSNVLALSRFFWFTIEFGLMRQQNQLYVYGSGLLSSAGEIEHSVISPHVQRHPFQLEWIINQSFEINHYQSLLFIIDSFEQLYEEVNRLEQWLLTGKLDFVAPGEPTINENDLESFLLFNK